MSSQGQTVCYDNDINKRIIMDKAPLVATLGIPSNKITG